MIVCIPSKARPNTKTYTLFKDKKFKVFHFIEPQDIKEYKVPNKTKISIGLNNMGIGYCRNFILEWAKKNNHDWILMCDDDVRYFGISENEKTITKDSSIWFEIYDKVKKLPFEAVGISYSFLSWAEKKTYSVNSKFVEVCGLFNVSKINWEYENWDLKTDRDFCLKTIKNGHGILRLNRYWFKTDVMTTNKGGLFDIYNNSKEKILCIELYEKYKNWSKIKKIKNSMSERYDVEIDIKRYAKDCEKVCK